MLWRTFLRDGVLSDEDAREMREKAEAELLAHKSKMDADRAKQEQELHRKLSEKKRKRRADAAKNHVKELKELEKKHKEMQTKDGYCGERAAVLLICTHVVICKEISSAQTNIYIQLLTTAAFQIPSLHWRRSRLFFRSIERK